MRRWSNGYNLFLKRCKNIWVAINDCGLPLGILGVSRISGFKSPPTHFFKMNKVIFQKPRYKELRKEYNLFDMHVHSKYSDGIRKIKKILKRANKLGIGIAITDHNKIKGAVMAYKNRFNVKVIPGIEIMTTKYEELLFYFHELTDLEQFYSGIIKKNQTRKRLNKLKVPLNELIEYGKRFNAVVSIPHPYWPIPANYRRILKNDSSIFEKVDAIEVLNSQKRRKTNLKAIELCKRLNKSITGGSDTHILSELGRCVTCAKDDVLEDIVKNRVNVIGKEIRMIRKIRSHSSSATKNILKMS